MITVEALKAIAVKLNISEWKNITANSCINGGLNKTTAGDTRILQANCTCSFNGGTLCHVTNITIKRLNLNGEIPHELGNLTFLQRLDLTRNYFSGTIPTFLAQLPLVQLSIMANRLTGSIPEEIGNLSMLGDLNVEDNLLGGSLPASIGNLSSLYRLVLTANNFTGQIPESFGKLKNLEEFRADGNTFSGQLPNFIGNWTNLKFLNMQGTSMEGPIPPELSLLKNLTELMITDLTGSNSTFPNLLDMKAMQTLVLRNCLISGSIPDYIGDMTSLKTLDLSFNQLSGPTIQNLNNLKFVFLTNNSLTGAIPNKISDTSTKIKIKDYDRESSFCRNLFSSYSSEDNTISSPCLKKGLPCSETPKYESLFINCGGRHVRYENNDYLEDTSVLGNSASYFYSDSLERWAFSSTGVFLGTNDVNTIATNVYSLNITGPEYYQSARLAATSLKYYGLCMLKGNYKVKLHFAEIMYTDDQTYKSLGRRLFNVYIQGKRYLKDFNIEEEAGGVGKNITKEYDVDVNGTTLEIHLYWAGKGTTALPERGVYGPLISAISVTSNNKHTSGDTGGGGLSGGAIAGIVISSFLVAALILLFLQKKGYLWGKDLRNSDLQGLKTGYFSLKQIKAATNNFDSANKIGEGGFGPVYKGIMSDGVAVAVTATAHALQEEGNILELVDPSLESKYSEEEALMLLNISLLCTNPTANLRPQMSTVVSMIEGNIPIEASVLLQPQKIRGTMEGIEMISQDSSLLEHEISTFSNDSEVERKMVDGPWESSSASTGKDLYTVRFD
ncbi:hypothetical protein ACFE04_022397 [Oxalis oulophora]